MGEPLLFRDREAFRAWLCENGESCEGVWLLFGKKGGPATLRYPEAVEEALCFGWIDGRMQRMDDARYKRHFSMRRAGSNWSEKNKALAVQLEAQGKMTDLGRAKIAEAKRNGQWDKAKPPPVTEAQVADLARLLEGHEPAHTNFMGMAPSVQRTYARAYFDAKTDAGRAGRLVWMVGRLDKNLKPM